MRAHSLSLLTSVASVLTLAAVGCQRQAEQAPARGKCLLTRASSAEDLVDLMQGYDGFEGRAPLMDAVARLRTVAAKDALLTMAKRIWRNTPRGQQALIFAAEQFGKGLARDIVDVYRECQGVDGIGMRGTCARILARFAEEDDWCMNVIVDIWFDEEELDVVSSAATAFGTARERAIRIVEARLPGIPDCAKKTYLKETIEVIRTGRMPGNTEQQKSNGDD